MTKPHRQRYGLGSFIKKAAKKIGKGAKKVWKSPLGKAAMLGLGAYGLGGGSLFTALVPLIALKKKYPEKQLILICSENITTIF